MDAAALAKLVSLMQDQIQDVADALKKVASDNMSPESTPASVDLNMALLQVDAIAIDLGQLVFQVEDAMRRCSLSVRTEEEDRSSVGEEGEAWASLNLTGDDSDQSEGSSDEVLCSSSEDCGSVESDRSWRLQSGCRLG